MNMLRMVFSATALIALVGCSESGNVSNNGSSDTTQVQTNTTINAANYQNSLQAALTQLRGEHFEPFIAAVGMTNQRFTKPLPDASSYFGNEPMQLGPETISCDSGVVTRNIVSSDVERFTVSADFDFTECTLGLEQFDGLVTVSLQGDTPSRLGGQRGEVTMNFNGMQLTLDSPTGEVHTLTGEYKNVSGWGAAFIGYQHDYKTASYTLSSTVSEISITDAEYTEKLESDYYPETEEYYRLSEVGRLSLIDQTRSANSYTITIEPELIYNSQFNANGRPIYADTIASGVLIFALSSGDTVGISVDSTDMSMLTYDITADGQSFSVTDAWLNPIPCNDNSVLNNRDLCSSRL